MPIKSYKAVGQYACMSIYLLRLSVAALKAVRTGCRILDFLVQIVRWLFCMNSVTLNPSLPLPVHIAKKPLLSTCLYMCTHCTYCKHFVHTVYTLCILFTHCAYCNHIVHTVNILYYLYYLYD